MNNFEKIPQINNFMNSNRFIKLPYFSHTKAKWTGL